MAEVLPPLAIWAAGKGMKSGEITTIREDYLGLHVIGDAYDFTIDIGQTYDVMIETDCEHRNHDPSQSEIYSCQTTITPMPTDEAKYTINENAYYFPDEAKPSGQTSYISMVFHGQTMPETMIAGRLGKPLSSIAQIDGELGELIGGRIIHSILNSNIDNIILVETVAVTGAGRDAA